MLAIEPCIRRPDLINYLKISGYGVGILEGYNNVEYDGPKRITLERKEIKNFKLKKNKEEFIVFAKPYDTETLRFSAIKPEIKGITVDDSNIRIFRKAMLNLLSINNKIVDVSLKSSSFVISRVIAWGVRWDLSIVFSSNASYFNEIWPILSKINYLVVHGAPLTMAYRWVLIEPFKLFSKD